MYLKIAILAGPLADVTSLSKLHFKIFSSISDKFIIHGPPVTFSLRHTNIIGPQNLSHSETAERKYGVEKKTIYNLHYFHPFHNATAEAGGFNERLPQKLSVELFTCGIQWEGPWSPRPAPATGRSQSHVRFFSDNT